MKKYVCILFLLFSLAMGLSAQYDDKPARQTTDTQENTRSSEEQPREQYRWPLDINNGFSSGFQEFRSSHFHAGFDLRTFQKNGFPVHAIADGVIVKIRNAKRGSGRGLYLKHDDGNTSVYYHLSRFEDKLENMLKRLQQSTRKRYTGNYYLKQPLRYKKGEIIGYSGESGSGFPHLHLEIRDKDYFALNPFPLIKLPAPDKNFPVLRKLLARNRDHASLNGVIGESLFKFQKRAKDYYYLSKPLLLTGSVDLVLEAFDISDTGRHCAPYGVSVFIDESRYFQLNFDRFEGDDNNQLGLVYDMMYSNAGTYFFNLFTQKGYALEQQKRSFDQVMENLDHGKHTLRIQVGDNAGNVSTGVVPFYKVQEPVLRIGQVRRGDTGNELHLEILELKSEAPPDGEIKIDVFDRAARRISTGSLHYHTLTEPRSLVLKDFSNEAVYIDFCFYAHDVLYYKQRCVVQDSNLAGLTGIEYDTFLNRDEVFVVVKNRGLGASNLGLTVLQGGESQTLEPRCGSENIYFRFTPMNRENRVLLRFSVLKNGEKVAEIQESLDLIYLREGEAQEFRYHEFEAYFGVRAVYEPKVLKVEERNYSSDYPVLSRQVSIAPYHFPFLDTVYYKFKKELPNPQQVGIFQYSPFTGKWGARYTEYDAATQTYRIRLISSGVFALMRDTFAPSVWFSRPKGTFKKSVKRLIVKITDKGKGVNDTSIKVWLNGKRICTAYDCPCEYDPDRSSLVIEELGSLKVGENILRVHVRDYAGNVTDRAFSFTLK